MNIYRVRMALARRIAPAAIMVDPFPGDGVMVVYRSNSDSGYSVQWAMKADKFRLKSTTRLPNLDYGRDDYRYRPHPTFTRFVGTVAQ